MAKKKKKIFHIPQEIEDKSLCGLPLSRAKNIILPRMVNFSFNKNGARYCHKCNYILELILSMK